MRTDPDYVTIKVEAEIDVRRIKGGRVVEGIKFSQGGKSLFIWESAISEDMDTQLLTLLNRAITDALKEPVDA